MNHIGFFLNCKSVLGNPASTTKTLFYFGFLTEQLSRRVGRRAVIPVVGAMYAFHEMTNPEYWYEGLSFGFVFVGVTIYATIYLWRRSAIIIWLNDGVGRFISNL